MTPTRLAHDMYPRRFSEFLSAYREAVYFTERPDGAGAATWDNADESVSMVRALWDDCAAFFDAHTDDIFDYGAAQAGHDFWLTRNGHGAGFWEEDYGTPEICARLDAAARAAGPRAVYLWGAGTLYLEEG